MNYMESIENTDMVEKKYLYQNESHSTEDKIAARFEILKIRCNSGHENPLMNYDSNFFTYFENFSKKYNLSEKSKNNVTPVYIPSINKYPLCCKQKARSGYVFSISAKSEKSITINKREIFSSPGPLSDGETLSWV